MHSRQSAALPTLWLLSDARNDAGLEAALRALPRGSGFVFRHGHLPGPARRARFAALRRIARRHGHRAYLRGDARQARAWHADGSYGEARGGGDGARIVTAHSLREIAAAHRCGARAIMLSPVFATRSHPGAGALGRVRFLLLARRARVPAIALGGMTRRRARGLRTASTAVYGWAAIDGLSRAGPLDAAPSADA